jgi:hypothetical protein
VNKLTKYQALIALYDTGSYAIKTLTEVNTMDSDKRERMPPIPPDYKNLLNPSQLHALNSIQGFGWTLQFVRREGLDVPLPVIRGADGKAVATIDEDGNLDMNPDIVIRDPVEIEHKKAG